MLVQTLFFSAFCALATHAKRQPCPHGLAIDITNGTTLPDKTIEFDGLKYNKRNYYSVRNGTQTFGCICNMKRRCVRKCCPTGQTFKKNVCTPSPHKLATSPDLIVHRAETEVSVSREHFTILSRKFCKEGAYMLDAKNFPSDDYYLQENGSLYRPTGNGDEPSYHQPQHFCFEFFEDLNYSSALVCFDDDADEGLEAQTIYSIGMMISMPFLLVTFLIYACIPELQNLHGKCLMCYVITLFTAYVFLVSIQLSKEITPAYCVTAPFIVYFAFLVSFLWLNVMCIDIWWTFSGLRGFQGSARQSERKRFLIYSAYAWGVPLFMLILTAILQFVDMPEYIIKPGFGTTKCWFPDDKTVGYYFYGPILLVIISNMCLFTYTTFKIWTVHRDTDRSMGHDSQRHGDETDKQRLYIQLEYLYDLLGEPSYTYKLYLKLMLVFGLNWLMEIISWALATAVTVPDWLWYVTDMCNAMYGVFIFFIFVCKANVWKLVKKRYHVFMGRPYLAKTFATGSSTRSTGFSHSVPNGSSELQMNDHSNM